jgi:hypothetical protein
MNINPDFVDTVIASRSFQPELPSEHHDTKAHRSNGNMRSDTRDP